MNQEMKEGLPHMGNNIIHMCFRQQLGRPFSFQGGAFACGSHPGLKHLGYSVFPLRRKADLVLTLTPIVLLHRNADYTPAERLPFKTALSNY